MARNDKLPWFRFYTEAFADPKLRRLKPEARWLWVSVLGAARQSPLPGWLLISERVPYGVSDLADYAALTARQVDVALGEFDALGLVEFDRDVGAWRVTGWDERQFESDVSTDRVKRFRERRRNVSETAPDTETDNRTKEVMSDYQGQATCG